MFIISKSDLKMKMMQCRKLNDAVYFHYDDCCQFNLISTDKLIIGRQYKGILSDKDGSYIEVSIGKDIISFVRDSWGSIPVYYSYDGCMISDTLNLIQENSELSPPDYGAIAEYISAAYTVGSRTIYENIKVLMPDEMLSVSLIDQLSMEPVRDEPHELIDEKDLPFLMEKILTLSIEDLINRTPSNLLSDKNYINLSGGTDSSLILSKIKEYSPNFEVESLIYYHDDWRSDIDDYKYSRLACDKYKIKQNQKNINNSSYADSFSEYIKKTKNIMHTYAPSFYMTNKKSMCDGKISMVINGTGPDESMIGTEKISIESIGMLDSTVMRDKDEYLLNNIDYLKISVDTITGFFKEDAPFLNDINCLDFYSYRKKIASHVRTKLVLGEEFSDFQRTYHFYTILQDHIKNIYSATQQSNSKICFPYLTNDMYRLIFSVSFYSLNFGNEYKSILKKILLKYFPESFVYRKKVGFQSPSTPYFLVEDGMGALLRGLLRKESKIFSEEYTKYIQKQLDSDTVDLLKRYDYSMWAYVNIRLLEEQGCFHL